MDGIYFPNLGIFFEKLNNGICLGGFCIKYYGIIIALGFIAAYFIVSNEAKRTKQSPDYYLDLILWLVIPVILGARAYYVLFQLDDYIVKGDIKQTLTNMLNIRNGGLAIYGGIIVGVLVGYIYSKKKKHSFMLTADTAAFGLLIGQIMGRFGNFFNREAFGSYTTSKFAMAIPIQYFKNEHTYYGKIEAGEITKDMIFNLKKVNGWNCIMVHPTFLYEATWNLCLLIFLLIYRKHKKFVGEFAYMYLAGYGIGRFFIEGLRSDSLMLTEHLKVSQCVGLVCFAFGSIMLLINYIKYFKNKNNEADNRETE